MRKLIVSEFLTLDGVMQAPGGADEDTRGRLPHGGWTLPYWHDDIGAAFGALMQDVDAFLLGRKTYVIHATAFEPMPAGDSFGDMMNTPAKVRRVEDAREARVAQHHDHPRRRRRRGEEAQGSSPARNIITDGSHELVHTLLRARPRRRAAPAALPTHRWAAENGCSPRASTSTFKLKGATPYPSGVVDLTYLKT